MVSVGFSRYRLKNVASCSRNFSTGSGTVYHITPDGAKKKPRYRKQYRGQVNQGSGIDCITQKAKPPRLSEQPPESENAP